MKKTEKCPKKRFLKFVQIQIEPEPLGLQKWFLHFWNLCSKMVNLSTFGGLYNHYPGVLNGPSNDRFITTNGPFFNGPLNDHNVIKELTTENGR